MVSSIAFTICKVTCPVHSCNFLFSLPVSLDSEVNNSGEFFPFFSLGFPMTFEITAAAYKPCNGNSTGFMHTQEDGIFCPFSCPFITHFRNGGIQTAHLCKHATHFCLVMKQGLLIEHAAWYSGVTSLIKLV